MGGVTRARGRGLVRVRDLDETPALAAGSGAADGRGQELWGSLLILPFSQVGRKRGHQLGWRCAPPLSSYSTAAPHTVFEKRVCVRLCSVCSFVSEQAPYKVASGMGTLGGWRLAPGLQDGRGWSVFTLWRPGEGAWGRRWERARRERGAVHPHIQGGAPLLPPAPGRFHPGVCWGDRWGDWGETRQAPRTG